jgi:hypothetical protein
VQGIGRRVATLGRRGRPQEGAPTGQDAEAVAARGAACSPARRRVAAPCLGERAVLGDFGQVFLPKI